MIAQRRLDIHWGWACRWIRLWDVQRARAQTPPVQGNTVAGTAQPAQANVLPAAELPVFPVVPTGDLSDEDEEEDEEDEEPAELDERLPLLLRDHALELKKQQQRSHATDSDADREEREAREREQKFRNAMVIATDRECVYLFDASLNAKARCRFTPEGTYC